MVADVEESIQHEENMMIVHSRQLLDDSEEIYTIPVAVHIIHKGEEIGVGSNISDEQIYSAITQVNQAFAKEVNTDSDGLNAPTNFRWQLCNNDDQGNYTTGIYRVNGAVLSEAYEAHGIRANTTKGERESVVKSWSRLDNKRVYNVWIVSEIDGNNAGSGVQGYAYFPTTSTVDGTVIVYNAFGTVGNRKSYTRKNKTFVHELGHALALFHTFQGSSCIEGDCNWSGDRVCDTPPTVKNSNANQPACGGTQQVWNVMDYTSENVKTGFVMGQSQRMLLAGVNSRWNLLTSNALDKTALITATATIEIVSPNEYCAPNSKQYLTVEVHNTSDSVIHEVQFDYTIGNLEDTYNWVGAIGAHSSVKINLAKIETNETKEIVVQAQTINRLTPLVGVTANAAMIIPTNEPCRIEGILDNLMGQVSWDITRASDMKIVYESDPYPNFDGGDAFGQDIYLPDGDFILTFQDLQLGFQTNDAYFLFLKPDVEVVMHEIGENAEAQKHFSIGKKIGDLNGDGVVNIADISILNQAFGTVEGDEGYDDELDLNKDGVINIADFSILLQKFGEDQQ
jgi:hypothetical protein